MQIDRRVGKQFSVANKTMALSFFACILLAGAQCGQPAPAGGKSAQQTSKDLDKIFTESVPEVAIKNDAQILTQKVEDPIVESISVLPEQVALFPGGTKKLEIFAVYSDRSKRLLADGFGLEAEDSLIAEVEGTDTILGKGVGVTQAIVTVGNLTQNVIIEVRSIDVSKLDIHPSTMLLGQETKFSAVANYSDGSSEDVTPQVQWQTLDESFISLAEDSSEPGVFVGNKVGEATIAGSFHGKLSSKIITVQTLPIVGISIESESPQILLGAPAQLKAIGHFSNDDNLDITTSVHWYSENLTRGTVSNEPGAEGLLTTVQPGSLVVGASLGEVTASVSLNITSANFASVRIEPEELKAGFGMQLQARLIGVMANGDEQDITNQAIWSSAQATIASISNEIGKQGQIQALAEGTADITAQYGNRLAVKPLVVGGAALIEIEVSTDQALVACGTSQPQFSAKGRYSDNSEADITANVSWSSGNQNVAMVSNAPDTKGLVTTVGIGVTYIQASILEPITGMNISDSSQIEAGDPILSSLRIKSAGGKTSIPAGEKLQLTAEGLYTCPVETPEDFTTQANYTADLPAMVTIGLPGPKGQVNAIGSPDNNTAVIVTAVYAFGGYNYSGEFHLTVRPKEIKNLVVSAQNTFVEVGQTIWVKPRVTYTDNSIKTLELADLGVMVLTYQITFPVPNETLATFDTSQGTMTGVLEGNYNLRLNLQTTYGNFGNQIQFSTRSQCNLGIRYGLYCWYISDRGDSCDQKCSDIGGSSVPDGIISYVGSAGPSDACTNVLNALNWNGVISVANPNETFAGGQGLGCSIFDNGSFRVGKRYLSPDTTADALFTDFRRVCACDR